MPLPSPILDDRSYQQLRDELIRRIPVYAPEWTDHNPSDPGVTLLELFAYLGESLLYRFNQIPEATKLAFLRLLDVPLQPATSARAMLALTTAKLAGVPVDQGSEALAGKLPFETESEVHAWPVELLGLGKVIGEVPADDETRDFVARALDARGGLAPDEQAAFYRPQLVPADPAAPDALAVDLGATVDGLLWLAVLEAERTEPDLSALSPEDRHEQLRIALKEGLLTVGFVPDEEVLSRADVDACPGAGAVAAAPPVVWQISTGKVSGNGVPEYRELVPVADTTRGLSRPGTVRLRLPRDPFQFGTFTLTDPDLEGTGDLPPLVEDEDQAGRILFWLRAFRRDRSSLKRVLWVGANAAEAVQAKSARPEFLGSGSGQPDQAFRLVNRQVIPGSLTLEVEEADGWTPWSEVDGFHASGESDRHFVLDREAGMVRFGNGVRGRLPQIGERLRATRYRFGGGRAGNVPAGAIDKLPAVAGIKAKNVLPARGGGDAEPVADALERIPGEFRRHDRAVAAGDFRELALATPGADVGRAEVLPLFHPRNETIQAAGVVSVVVWPREDRRRPDAPRPDRTLLSAVCRHLDERRLVTTELYVIPPTYRKIAVSVGFEVKPGYGIEAVRRWVELVLRQYLAPLPPYGPNGEGWPLGRRVHGPELEAAALQVEGVEFLNGLDLARWNETAGIWVRETPVVLERWEVPWLSELTVVQGPPLAAGEALGPPPTDRTPVPIPTLKEEC